MLTFPLLLAAPVDPSTTAQHRHPAALSTVRGEPFPGYLAYGYMEDEAKASFPLLPKAAADTILEP